MNADVQACAKELTAVLRSRLAQQNFDTAESINLLEKMGEPAESLQVCLPLA